MRPVSGAEEKKEGERGRGGVGGGGGGGMGLGLGLGLGEFKGPLCEFGLNERWCV